MTITAVTRLYQATDALARLTGKLDASINYACPITLTEIRDDLCAARATLFAAIHDTEVTLP